MSAPESFYKAFDLISLRAQSRLDAQPDWHNGTQYLSGAARPSVGVLPGAIAWSIDHMRRRILLVGTPLGAIVLFERYTPGTSSGEIIVVNFPSPIIEHIVGGGGALSQERLDHILGDDYMHYQNNLGVSLRDYWAKAQQVKEDAPVELERNTAEDSRELGKPISGNSGT